MILLSCTLALLCLTFAENRTLTNSSTVGNNSLAQKDNCKGITLQKCSSKSCPMQYGTCRYYYFHPGLIGTPCKECDGCTDTLTCIHGVCSCAGFEYWLSTNKCIKKKTINSTCTASFECVGKLACIRGECQCVEELYWNGTDCYIRFGINSTCNSLFECKQSLQCLDNICCCCTNYYWNGHFCEKKRKLESTCNSSIQCIDTVHCLLGVCQCRKNEMWTGEICKTNACFPNDVCLNGGKCIHDNQSKSKGYTCQCTDGYLGEKCQYSDGKATEFIVIFQPNQVQVSTLNPRIIIAVDARTTISIFSFSSNQNTSKIITTGNLEYNLGSVKIVPNGLDKAGFKIHSNVPITLYVILHNVDPDGYLAIPIRYASTQYIIASFEVKNCQSVLSISPIHSRTVITINLKLRSGSITYRGVQYSNNDTLTILINKNSVFELSHSSDLSGTIITASKPVVVVSGNSDNNINGVSGSNIFVEMMLPTNQLDVLYIIPFVARRKKCTARLFAVNNTNITKKIGNEFSQSTLKSRDYLEFFHNTITYVRASSPIMVQLYPHEIPSGKGDAFMMTIPGVNQYLYEYLFMAPSDYISNISVTVETAAIDGFVLDGKYLTLPSVLSVMEEGEMFSAFSLPITPGSHHIIHTQKIRFGLWVYGTKSDRAYGYPAGMAYKST